MAAIQLVRSFNANPNLINYFECCEDEDNYYIVLQYCFAGDLYANLLSRHTFDELTARRMMKHLVNGLHTLQQLGIGHRDMSPQNILVTNRAESIRFEQKLNAFRITHGSENIADPEDGAEEDVCFVISDFGMCRCCKIRRSAQALPHQERFACSYCPLRRRNIAGKVHYIAPGQCDPNLPNLLF